jgi:hypothetical protein
MELVIKLCLVERDNIKYVDPAFTMGTETRPVSKAYRSIRNTRRRTDSRNLAVLTSVPIFYYQIKTIAKQNLLHNDQLLEKEVWR